MNTHPTYEQLKESGEQGIFVINPDNDLKFRVTLWYGLAFPMGVHVYHIGACKPTYSPQMGRVDIEHWLSELILAD